MKIRLYGYNDRDAVLESLLLSNGNIELALDILEQDSKSTQQKKIAPELPRRPQPSSANTNEKHRCRLMNGGTETQQLCHKYQQ